MTPVELAVEVAGWAGAALILGAYLLLSMGRLTGQSAAYQAMNVGGAAGFIINGWWLLGAGVVICEHMTGLERLPDEGFPFSAVPPKVRGMGSFPVRAYAVLG